jgi:hypothetical protein
LKELARSYLTITKDAEAMMGEWKAQINFRVRQDLRRELQDWANCQQRAVSNLAELLVEWALERLKKRRRLMVERGPVCVIALARC